MQFLVTHKFFVCVFVSKNCEIWFIVENGVTDKEIIMLDDGGAFGDPVIS